MTVERTVNSTTLAEEIPEAEFLLIYWGKTDDEEAERQGSTDRQTGR